METVVPEATEEEEAVHLVAVALAVSAAEEDPTVSVAARVAAGTAALAAGVHYPTGTEDHLAVSVGHAIATTTAPAEAEAHLVAPYSMTRVAFSFRTVPSSTMPSCAVSAATPVSTTVAIQAEQYSPTMDH